MSEALKADLLSGEQHVEYAATATGYALVALRVLMGWVLFIGGAEKVLAGDWSASGFLLNAIPEGNPVPWLWPLFADMGWLIDPLVMWGLTLTGFGLIIGGAVRWNAFWGAVMMLFFWLASLPLANGILVDSHIIYAALLFALGALGAGRVFGADRYLEQLDIVQQYPRLKYLLG